MSTITDGTDSDTWVSMVGISLISRLESWAPIIVLLLM